MQARLELMGHGWLTLSLSHGEQAAELVASYLHDTPRELLEALVRLLSDEGEARVVFHQEPGEWLLRMRRFSGELLRIEVHGPSEDGPVPEPLGEPMFRHTEPAERFTARILGEFDRVLREGGEEGYARSWSLDPFPRRAYEALTHALRERGLRPG
jgi:hypothetical protein